MAGELRASICRQCRRLRRSRPCPSCRAWSSWSSCTRGATFFDACRAGERSPRFPPSVARPHRVHGASAQLSLHAGTEHRQQAVLDDSLPWVEQVRTCIACTCSTHQLRPAHPDPAACARPACAGVRVHTAPFAAARQQVFSCVAARVLGEAQTRLKKVDLEFVVLPGSLLSPHIYHARPHLHAHTVSRHRSTLINVRARRRQLFRSGCEAGLRPRRGSAVRAVRAAAAQTARAAAATRRHAGASTRAARAAPAARAAQAARAGWAARHWRRGQRSSGGADVRHGRRGEAWPPRPSGGADKEGEVRGVAVVRVFAIDFRLRRDKKMGLICVKFR